MATVDLPDTLYQDLKQEAARSSGGDVAALLASLLPFWQASSDPMSLRRGKAGDGAPTEVEVIQALAATGSVSVEVLASMAKVFDRAVSGVQEARTGGAAAYLHAYVDWVLESPSTRCLWCTLVTVQAAAETGPHQAPAVVSRASGFLMGGGSGVTGTLEHTFSDRQAKGGAPFDRSQADQLGVELTISRDDPSYHDVVLTALSWGGGQQKLQDGAVRGGVLTATGDAIGHQVPAALYCISLARTAIPG